MLDVVPTSPGVVGRASRALPVTLHSPDSSAALAFVRSRDTGEVTTVEMAHDGVAWLAELDAAEGDRYWFEVDGVGPLVDPRASDIEMTADGPRGVVRRQWPSGASGSPKQWPPVVYEVHVRGFARTFDGLRERLPYLADLGVDVIELMPLHPFDTVGNYWGYMPIVWGAVHRPYAATDDAPAELARLIEAAHGVGIHVWLDVVFNHTGEGDATMPTWTLRGLDDAHAYRRDVDGTYNDDAGCGNVVDVRDEEVRRLILEALERLAALGVDGFRFDLASILTRDGGALVRAIGDWAKHVGVTLVAEPWDLAEYQVGDAFPDRRWLQWNDRFRDDVRGFLRSEPGMVPQMIERIAGSPDLFGADRWRTVNFLDAHDGLTLHDLTAFTSDRHRSWDAGPYLRLQQIENAFAFLLLSAGTAMFVMGDEFARTQHGHDNPYDVDGPVSWVDWDRLAEWEPLHRFVRALIGLRRARPVAAPRFYGTCAAPDTSIESRSLAWATDDLYVVANMWWHPLEFAIQEPGPWRLAIATRPDIATASGSVQVPERTIAVLIREEVS